MINSREILNILPHRYPFLLVDGVIEMAKDKVIAYKNVSFNEPFFMGHFPGNPVMPGVLIVEALAQTGALLANTVGVFDPQEKMLLFMGIDKAKFLHDIPLEEIQTKHSGSRLLHTKKIPIFDDEKNPIYLLGISEDITERHRAAKEREAAHRRFTEGIIAAQEEERQRIARELHDALGQLLTSISVQAHTIEERVVDSAIRRRLNLVNRLVERAIGEVASLARRLRPPTLDELGFVAALGQNTAACSAAGVTVDVHVRGLGPDERLPRSIETALYRIVQEALNNVNKHAQASTVSVIIDRESDYVKLIVEDDGQGFDPEAPHDGLGLTGMHERAQLLGGTMQIESTPQNGTAIYVTLPLTPHHSSL